MTTLWKPNAKAICIATDPWRDGAGILRPGAHPVRDQLYTIEGAFRWDGRTALFIVGFSGMYDSEEFRPVIPLSELIAAEHAARSDQTVQRAIDTETARIVQSPSITTP